MSVEQKDSLTKVGRAMRLGGIAWITAAAAGIITGTSLAQLVLWGAVGSLFGAGIENRKFFGFSKSKNSSGGSAHN